ncbi:MAG: rod-binding protein [Oligoflexales bacterium]
MKTITKEIGQKLPNTPLRNNGTVSTKVKGEESGLLGVAKDFSSLFFDTVLQSMRKSVVKSEFIGGGHAEDMYQSMLDSEYAKLIAKQDQTGFAKMIADQLTKISDVSRSTANTIKKNHAMEAYKMAKPPIK